MDYETWKSKLFEDAYPTAKLSHGDIHYHPKSPDHMQVSWGGKELTLSLWDFYQSESESPLMEIKRWAYSQLPVIAEELSDSYVAYNPFSGAYDSYTIRPFGCVIPMRDVNPVKFPTYGELDLLKKIVNVKMDGTVICLSTKEPKIPSVTAVSHKENFSSLINDFVDYDEKLSILLPDSINTNHVFVGHRNSILRLAENFTEGTTVFAHAGDWFNKLSLLHKGNNV